jgi:hypothetical protein
MKNILFPILGLVSRVGIIMRLIGLALLFMGLSDAYEDIRFLSSYNNRKTFTIEELSTIPRKDIPKYVKVEHALAEGSGVVSTMTKKGRTVSQTLTYPVFPITEFSDSIKFKIAKVFFQKPYHGDADSSNMTVSLSEYKGVEGSFNSSSTLGKDVENLLKEDSLIIAEDPIIITKGGTLPTMQGSSIQLIVCLLLFFIIAASFVKGFFKPEEVV